MAINISGTTIVRDQNSGVVAMTINQADQGAIQMDGVLRLNAAKYLRGDGLLECLELDDRNYVGVIAQTGETWQEALGYPASNFIDPAAIKFL